MLDDLRRAHFGFVRVEPNVPKGTSLTQEVPALIEFNLEVGESLAIGFAETFLLVQPMFFGDQTLNVVEDRLILGLIVHERLLRMDRIETATVTCYACLRSRSTDARHGFPFVTRRSFLVVHVSHFQHGWPRPPLHPFPPASLHHSQQMVSDPSRRPDRPPFPRKGGHCVCRPESESCSPDGMGAVGDRPARAQRGRD